MIDKKTCMPPFSRGFMLEEACPQAVARLIEFFNIQSRQDLAQQLKQVFVPLQGLAGSPDEFSFMAYAIPHLSQEQRMKMRVSREEEIVAPVPGGAIKVQTDFFGKINWFWFTGLPEIHCALKERMKRPPSVHLSESQAGT